MTHDKMIDSIRYNLEILKVQRGSDYSGVEALEKALVILENPIKEVLSTIKEYCKSKDPSITDCCADCPFNIENSWAKFCMFAGPHFDEGVIPEDWEIKLLDCDKINNEI